MMRLHAPCVKPATFMATFNNEPSTVNPIRSFVTMRGRHP